MNTQQQPSRFQQQQQPSRFQQQQQVPQQQIPQQVPQQQVPQQQIPQYPPQYQQPIPQYQQPSNLQQAPISRHSNNSTSALYQIKYPNESEETPVCAVVVTINGGSSYDDLFRSVPQKSPHGRIAVYAASLGILEPILHKMEGKEVQESAELKSLFHNMSCVEADCVLFNWECCSSFSCQSFGAHSKIIPQLMKKLLDKGHMIMYSDFALKALVADWDEPLLGPNPFVKFGEFSDSFDLRFDPPTLIACPSAQLQRVGELCENGTARVHALGGTIAFSVNKLKSDTSKYKLQVLTVATRLGSTAIPSNLTVSAAGATGAAGHVLLTYPTGGQLLVSCGHWIELSRLDVSVDTLLNVAKQEMGAEYATNMQTEISNLSGAQQASRMQDYARMFVQQSAPCNIRRNNNSNYN